MMATNLEQKEYDVNQDIPIPLQYNKEEVVKSKPSNIFGLYMDFHVMVDYMGP